VLIIFAISAFISTLLGGLAGLKYKDKLHLILGFTAGVLLAVVAFDVLPEIIKLTNKLNIDPIRPMVSLVIGFLLFHILEKLLLIHHAQEENYGEHKHPTVGILSALALSGHSFLDGVGIGLGFQVSPTIGILISIAVISHDFSDGLNTVILALINKNTVKRAFLLLLVDSIAPVLGAISTYFFTLPSNFLVLYLGFFAGFLLYIGASEILPEAHSKRPSVATILMTIFGAAFIFLVTRVI
jgi:ZIP family zinc transporter